MLKTYKEEVLIRSYQTDMNARLRPSALLQLMQEAAGAHAEKLGIGRNALIAQDLAWVLTRIEVEMDRWPSSGEKIMVETFPMALKRWFFPRYFVFRDERGRDIGRAASLWVLLDLKSRRMSRPDAVTPYLPDNSDLLAPMGLPAVVSEVSGTLETGERVPVYTDLDCNGHVNNTRYVDWCCDALGIESMQRLEFRHLIVNFDSEVLPSQVIRTELKRLGSDFSFCGFEGDKRHFDIGGVLAQRV